MICVLVTRTVRINASLLTTVLTPCLHDLAVV